MALDPRLKGQECRVNFTQNGQIIGSAIAIQSNELKWMQDILSEGFLGETSERKDYVFKGVSGSVTLQFNGPQVFTLIGGIIDVAQRRIAIGTGLTVQHTFQFVNGRRAIVTMGGVAVGEIGMDTSSRTDYVKVTLPYEAEEAQISVV